MNKIPNIFLYRPKKDNTNNEIINSYKEIALNSCLSPEQINKVIANSKSILCLEDNLINELNNPDVKYIISCLKPQITYRNKRKDIKPEEIIKGAIYGDIIGSAYRFKIHDYSLVNSETLPKTNAFITGNTILTLAARKAVLENRKNPDYKKHFVKARENYRNLIYENNFYVWNNNGYLTEDGYNGILNDCITRISFIPAYYNNLDEMMLCAANSIMTTHNHVESLKGGLALSVCIWMALNGYKKEYIKEYIESIYHFGENLFEKYKKNAVKDKLTEKEIIYSSVEHSLLFSINCFFNTNSYEECMREILKNFGDTSSLCAIVGGLCVACYGKIGMNEERLLRILDRELNNGRK